MVLSGIPICENKNKATEPLIAKSAKEKLGMQEDIKYINQIKGNKTVYELCTPNSRKK